MARRSKSSGKSPVARTAARYNRIAWIYDLVESLSGGMKAWREELWGKARGGRMLEAGVGTGRNLPYHPRASKVTGIDVAEKMLARARQRAARLGSGITLLEADVQELPFPDGSFDEAAATCVFCSVPDPVRGLRELGRVVKPGGRILLLEHVRVDRPVIGRIMDFLNPIVVRMYGANINRRTVENVRRAGLAVESIEHRGPMNMVKLIVATSRKPAPRQASRSVRSEPASRAPQPREARG